MSWGVNKLNHLSLGAGSCHRATDVDNGECGGGNTIKIPEEAH